MVMHSSFRNSCIIQVALCLVASRQPNIREVKYRYVTNICYKFNFSKFITVVFYALLSLIIDLINVTITIIEIEIGQLVPRVTSDGTKDLKSL
jgi:hypothetical protein